MNKFVKIFIKPIRVFCIHHVCDTYNSTFIGKEDWMAIKEFKEKITILQQDGYHFISLLKASSLLQKKRIRLRKYAVLTADDGYVTLCEVLPWLMERHIPITIFINGKYTDGQPHYVKGLLPFLCLSTIQLREFVESSHGLINIQSHGYEHLDATALSPTDFRQQMEKNIEVLDSILPTHMKGVGEAGFHAYTWGRHNAQTDAILKEMNIIPVLIDGMKNYNDASCIHRELLENYDK